jgi:hypothetical protein
MLPESPWHASAENLFENGLIGQRFMHTHTIIEYVDF